MVGVLGLAACMQPALLGLQYAITYNSGGEDRSLSLLTPPWACLEVITGLGV